MLARSIVFTTLREVHFAGLSESALANIFR